jgi:peptidoglycan/LPS O-acetylase OafA/YrhL
MQPSAMNPEGSNIKDGGHPIPIRTGEDRVRDAKLRTSGFDYMRFVLALTVICAHCENIGLGPDSHSRFYPFMLPFWRVVLPFFFTLSGFLVAGSLERCRTMVSFIGLRALRLIPALATETVLSALILGPLFTTLPLHVYFTSHDFYTYLLNTIGDIHYYLPGVFADNPVHKVNAQLWTVPIELGCYLIIIVLAVFNVFTKRRRLLVIFSVLTALQIGFFLIGWTQFLTLADGRSLIMSSLTGFVFYRFYDEVRWSKARCIRMAIAAFLLVWLPNGLAIATLPLGYVAV